MNWYFCYMYWACKELAVVTAVGHRWDNLRQNFPSEVLSFVRSQDPPQKKSNYRTSI